MKTIVGRYSEVKRLEKVRESRKSEFVAVYGRRRVGKTFLVREFFQNHFDFHLTGLANATTEQQLVNFRVALQHNGFEVFSHPPQNWMEAFQLLSALLDKTNDEGRKQVIFLDELPWLDTPKSDFMMALEHFWNSWASFRNNVILVVCGSAASWMINQLINNHGGLHNRVTERIKLLPFILTETEEFLLKKGLQVRSLSDTATLHGNGGHTLLSGCYFFRKKCCPKHRRTLLYKGSITGTGIY